MLNSALKCTVVHMKKPKADTSGPAAYLLLLELPPPETQAPRALPLYSSLILEPKRWFSWALFY